MNCLSNIDYKTLKERGFIMKDISKKKLYNMVYSPNQHIPIGEAIKTENGEYALRVKRSKGNDIEVVPIGQLVSKIFQLAETKETKQ